MALLAYRSEVLDKGLLTDLPVRVLHKGLCHTGGLSRTCPRVLLRPRLCAALYPSLNRPHLVGPGQLSWHDS